MSISIPADAATLGSAAFGQNPLTVPVGATVTWTNNDTVNHTVTANDGSFSSMTIAPGGAFEQTFDTEGDFPYFCAIHGQAAMSGDIKVVPVAPGCPGAIPSVSPSESPSPAPSPSESPSPAPSPSESPSPAPSPSESPSPAPSLVWQ